MVDTISTLSMLPTLPAELQRNIFLHCDPHTLYTCVRFLNKDWHRAVQQELLAAQFRSKDWRVGLRITKRAPFTRPTNVLEQQTAQADERADEQIRQLNASRPGTREDALSPTPIAGPTVHVIPLRFTSYKESNTTLAFSTGNEWHALFEGMQVPEAGRLDLDFALVWRFPGDGGQEADMPGGDGWGTPDAENGWLSRFYCSNYDVRDQGSSDECADAETGENRVLRSTPLAPRVRQVVHVQNESGDKIEELVWSDEGHEYMSLDLELGIEFFVRRSARANLLQRKLEAEAAAADARERSRSATPQQDELVSSASGSTPTASWACSASTSGAVTPVGRSAPPPSRISMRTSAPPTPTGQLYSKYGFGKPSGRDNGPGANTPVVAGSSRPSTPSPLRSSSKKSPSSLEPARDGSNPSELVSNLSDTTLSGYASVNPSSSTRRGTVPRARFTAQLWRAERLPSEAPTLSPRPFRPGSPSYTSGTPTHSNGSVYEDDDEKQRADLAGWKGGDQYGRGSSRVVCEQSARKAACVPEVIRQPNDEDNEEEQEQEEGDDDDDDDDEDAHLRRVPQPLLWSWSR